MTDIDFDELDKAVSTAMGSSENEEKKDQSIPVAVNSRPTEPEPEKKPDRPVAAPAMRRSNGRFMDVMHPSADMKPTHKSADLSPKPSYAFPSGATEQSEPQPEIPTQQTKDDDQVDSDTQPMSTPFLSDAKVEKRPLGAYSDAVSDEPIDSADSESDVDAGPVTPLPAELQDDVLSLESKQSLSQAPVAGQTGEEAEVATEPDMPEKKVETLPVVDPEPELPVPPIIQQYKEQPSSAAQTSGAIFDTEHYHTPLVHSPKKKTGWLVVLWIFSLIVIGAGLGVAAYYFVLPNLL